MGNKLYITSIGSCLSSRVQDNREMAATLGKDERFLRSKIGTLELPRSSESDTPVSLAYRAALQALENAKLSNEDIDLCIFVTQNPENMGLPHNSAVLHDLLNLRGNVACFDIGLGCSGFVYALAVAKSMMIEMQLNTALIITSDQYGTHLKDDDANTQLIFGDGACATIISKNKIGLKIGNFSLETDGSGHKAIEKVNGKILMNGRSVFNFARKRVPISIMNILLQSKKTVDDVNKFVLHQGSKAILDEIKKSLKISDEKLAIELEGTGNLVSSSIPYILQHHLNEDTPKLILICGFGVGLSIGTMLLEKE